METVSPTRSKEQLRSSPGASWHYLLESASSSLWSIRLISASVDAMVVALTMGSSLSLLGACRRSSLVDGLLLGAMGQVLSLIHI
eukprot:5880517-Alexandrium_andersonii.AAC.1